jgi:hypothetical protein
VRTTRAYDHLSGLQHHATVLQNTWRDRSGILEGARAADPPRWSSVSASSMRVVIAEDQALLRTGLVRLLSDAGFDVVAEAADAEELLRNR